MDVHDFEEQLRVVPTTEEDVFTNRYPAWYLPHNPVISGAIMLGQSALSAYETIPNGFTLYAVQAQFLKPGNPQQALQYHVQRIQTTPRTACRVVHFKQAGVIKMMVTLSFMAPSREDKVPQRFECIPRPSKATLRAAATPIDPALDDADRSPPGGSSRAPKDWPAGTPYPAVSSQRQSVSQDKDVSRRVYRCKVRTLTPLSSPTAQIIAALFFTDFYVLDTPVTVQDIPYGWYRVGDKTKTLTAPVVVKTMATLNHTMHFCSFGGWDVHEGLLLECVTKWAKGRRAVIRFTMRDTQGKLVATGEQEGYFLFKDVAKSERSKM